MERRDSGTGSHQNKLEEEPWNFSHSYFGGGRRKTVCGSHLGGFPWIPRSYICSFCKREFKSAQALGGHMNVHRRDRARLRAETLPEGLTYKSSLPCFSSSPTYTSSSAEHCSIETRSPKMRKTMKTLFEFGDLMGFVDEEEKTKYGEREAVTLELDIGEDGGLEEDLDLELRLGFGLAA